MFPNHQSKTYRAYSRLISSLRPLALVLMASLLLAPAAKADPQEVNTVDVFGQDIWQRLENFYYQTLFDKAGDLSEKLYSGKYLRLDLKEGRLLLRQDATHLMLADHFGLTASGSVPVGSAFAFGGSLGAYVFRFRQVADPQSGAQQDTLTTALADWNPKAKFANTTTFQKNINPWIDAVIADVNAGNTDAAKSMLGDETPEQKYLDLLAGLKLPFEMPWTAKRFMDDSKVKNGDLATFEATGGLFARVQGPGWSIIQSPYAGLFLNGQFRFGVLKISDQRAFLRIDTTTQEGINFDFSTHFKIPVLSGVIFGKDKTINVSLTPFTINGQSYNSQLFARTFDLDFTKPGVADAYDAAVHGNLTVLDDMAAAGNQGVMELSVRYSNGHYNQSEFSFNFGPVKLQNLYNNANVVDNFSDERGTFQMNSANSVRVNYNDVNLLIFKVRQTRTNNITAQAFPLTPTGPLPARLVWQFDEVNFQATTSDQAQIEAFIKSLQPLSVSTQSALVKRTTYHAGFKIQVHPQGVADFQNHTPDQVWQAASVLLFKDAKVWQDDKARQTWTNSNPTAAMMANYAQVDHWASAFKTPPALTDIKTWFANIIEWQRASYWDILGVKLFLALMSPQDRYIALDVEDNANGNYSFTDGTNDLTAYPDDWDYINIPPIQL